MLSNKVKQKLMALTELPSIPAVLTAVFNEIDNPNTSAKSIASLIEQDQGLTARVLKAANSPLYGMTRSISTIDLAIVILGTAVIKEILLLLFAQKIFQKTNSKLFNAKRF
jgi:HD-like signal output (HDOD) protein